MYSAEIRLMLPFWPKLLARIWDLRAFFSLEVDINDGLKYFFNTILFISKPGQNPSSLNSLGIK